MFILSNKQLVSLTQLALYYQDYYQIITDFSQKNSNNTFIITRKTIGLDIEDHQEKKTVYNCNFHVNDKGYIQIDE